MAFAHAESTARSSKNVHTKNQNPFVVRAGPDHGRVPQRVLGNVGAPFPQALILYNRLRQTIKELIADPYGK